MPLPVVIRVFRGYPSWVSLRDSLRRIWGDPALLATEVLWRWMFGAAGIALCTFAIYRLQAAIEVTPEEQAAIAGRSPIEIAQTLAQILYRAYPIVLRLISIVIPALVLLWTVAATFGRGIVLARMFSVKQPRWTALVTLNLLRALSVVALIGAYFGCSYAGSLVLDPAQPNLLLFVIVFMPMFVAVCFVWAIAHWVLALASIHAVAKDSSVMVSVHAVGRALKSDRTGFTSVAAVNAAARTVAGVVFTALALFPLPLFAAVPELAWLIELFLFLLYCAVSDFLLLGRTLAYGELLRRPS